MEIETVIHQIADHELQRLQLLDEIVTLGKQIAGRTVTIDKSVLIMYAPAEPVEVTITSISRIGVQFVYEGENCSMLLGEFISAIISLDAETRAGIARQYRP